MDRYARQPVNPLASPGDRSILEHPGTDTLVSDLVDEDTVELDPSAQALSDSSRSGSDQTQVSVTVHVNKPVGPKAPAVVVSTSQPAALADFGAHARGPQAAASIPLSTAAPPPAPPSSPSLTTAPAPAASSPAPSFRPGETIRGRYLLEEQIGAGGAACIFRARDLRRDPVFDRDACVALKVAREPMRDRRDAQTRLRREYQQTQSLAHPNVIRVFDIDCEGDTWFLTMELLDGESLATLLACLSPQVLPRHEAYAILRGCGEALAFAHERGVLHCDFKPGNIFVTRSEEVRVLDFGVASPSAAARNSDSGRATRVCAATPCYASPEILEGHPPDERDDVFSFACVAYEVLTGRHPFERHSTIQARDTGMRVSRVPGLERGQFLALQRALSWSRKVRHGSMRELLADLDLDGQQAVLPGWLKFGAAVAASTLLAAILFNIYRDLQEDSPRPDATDRDRPAVETPADNGASESHQPVPAGRRDATDQKEQAPSLAAGAGLAGMSQPSLAQTQGPRTPLVPGAGPVQGARMVPGTRQTAVPSRVQTHPVDTARAAIASGGASRQSTARTPAAGRAASISRQHGSQVNRISFEQARIVVSEGAVSAVVRVRRLDDLSGRVRIKWRAIPGTAHPGEDYSMDGLGTIDIPEGHDVRVLFVPILNDRLREPNESFDVELFGLAGPGALEPITRATITVLDND